MNHKVLDRGTYAQIDTSALVHNYNELKTYCSFTEFFCPMVKANAYGHGDVLVAKTLVEAGCPRLGVGFIEEAIPLRDAGIDCEIFVFGVFQEACVTAIENMKLTPIVSTMEQFDYLERHLKSSLSIHLKFNTGMNRLGFEVADIESVKKRVSGLKKAKVTGICTHLQCGEDLGEEDGYSSSQLKRYSLVVDAFSEDHVIHHAFNSSSLINLKKFSLQEQFPFGVRPGISLYGYPPVSTTMNLVPAMSLFSKVVNIHKIQKGEVVSYGATWKAQRDSVIGVVPIGYADGYFRMLSNSANVLVGNDSCPLVGRVCMDYVMVDLTEVSSPVDLGDPVVLMGENQNHIITAEHLAEQSSTISYEVLTSVGERVPRIFI